MEVLDRQHGQNCVAVIPVFYRVDRSVVEEQSEKFGEAFLNHEVSLVSEERMMEWRNSLKETTHLDAAMKSKDGQR